MCAAEEIKGFVKQVLIVLGIASVFVVYPVDALWGRGVLIAALAGCAISTVNVIVGVASVAWAFDKPQPVFLKTILGGMAVRMAAIFVVLALLVKFTELNRIPLVGSMFGFYIIFQVLELQFVVKRGQDSKGT